MPKSTQLKFTGRALRNKLKLTCASALGLALTACATVATDIPKIPQADILSATPDIQQTTVDAHLGRLDRTHGIAWPMLVANADLCHERRRDSFGIRLGNDKTIRGLVDGFTLAQVRALGYSEVPVVLGVQPGSPADLAGLRSGAIPVQVGETKIEGDMGKLSKALAAYQKARAEEKEDGVGEDALAPLSFVFEQESGEKLDVAMAPITICDIPVSVAENDSINASANGRGINVRRGLLTFFENDEDVGFVVAHEIAHIVGRHVPKQRRNLLVTGYQLWGIPVVFSAGLFDSFFAGPLERFGGVERPPGQQVVTLLGNRIVGTRAFEREADYIGMYIAARSGLDVSEAEHVFGRFAELSARSTYGENSHPVTADRMLAIAAARAEVEAKQSAGEALVPNGWPFPLPVDEEE